MCFVFARSRFGAAIAPATHSRRQPCCYAWVTLCRAAIAAPVARPRHAFIKPVVAGHDQSTEHSAALRLAGQIGDKHEEARAHDGLGDCQHASGETGFARDHWQQALALYTELELPEADEARAKVAAAARGSPGPRQGANSVSA